MHIAAAAMAKIRITGMRAATTAEETKNRKCIKFVKGFCFKEKNVLHHKYLIYLHQTNTIVFTIISTIEQTKSIYSAPSLLKLDYLAMSFILLLAWSASQLKSKQHAQIS